MANRSYLYSSNDLPDSAAWSERKALHGIAEYRYDIPLAFKILLTGSPIACRSSIWETPENIALAGDYAAGLENLARYLARITDPAAQPIIAESLGFLRAHQQARKHFILECGEIFDLTEGSLAEKNSQLLAEIQDMAAGIEGLPLPLPAPTKQGLLSRLFKLQPPDPLSPYYELGLGAWSKILYYDFSQNEA